MNIRNKEWFYLCTLEEGEIILNDKNNIIEEIGLSRVHFVFICYNKLIINEINTISHAIFSIVKEDNTIKSIFEIMKEIK